MVVNLYKKNIRDDENYITLYGVFACDRESTKAHKYIRKEGDKYIYHLPLKNLTKDITSSWKQSVRKGEIHRANKVKVEGKTYEINGEDLRTEEVQITFKRQGDVARKEDKVINIIHNETNADIEVYPKVNYPMGVKIADLKMSKWKSLVKIDNETWDLKTLSKEIDGYDDSKGNNPIQNLVEKSKGQTKNFIFDINNSDITPKVRDWIADTYTDKGLNYVNKIMIIGNGKILKIFKKI